MHPVDTAGGSPEISTGTLNRFCTRAATGRYPIFQEIYVCRTCGSESDLGETNDFPLCICSACADCCHENHEVDFVGMGPCFCDCLEGSCRIADASILEAIRIGIHQTDENMHICQSLPMRSIEQPTLDEDFRRPSYTQDVYHIPLLQSDVAFRNRLVQQAKELIRHSRDTFWLDAREIPEDARLRNGSLCDLEVLALQVLHQHMKHYCIVGVQQDVPLFIMGAEWWVQVKPVSFMPLVSYGDKGLDALESDHFQKEAIDLHFDKDEEIAASFGLGVFPTLSTVTYLTESIDNAAPTLIFSRRYDSDENEVMAEMFISHPSCGKHVVFDGRLLHGAPSHPLLRKQNVNSKVNKSCESALRITFLVNIWLNYKPARVNSLPQSIRESICKTTRDSISAFALPSWSDEVLEFLPVESVPTISLSSLADQPEMLREPVELPFIGGKSTWAGDGDKDLAMVVKVYPPPPAHSHFDSVLIHFGPELEAMFDYCGTVEDAPAFDEEAV